MWGSLIRIEEETLRRERFDRAKILVLVQKKTNIPTSFVVTVDRKKFKVVVSLENFEEEVVEATHVETNPKENFEGSIINGADSIPSGGGLLDVPIVDLGPYASEESSLEVRNEQGLVISGVGLPCLDLKRTRVNTKNKKAKSVAFPGPRIFNRWRGMSEFSSLYTREEGQRKNGNKKLLSHLLDEPSPTTPVDLPRDPVKEQEDLERTNCARKEAILSLEVGEAVGFRFNEERLVVIRNLESLENIA
ncbi:hypothetical protein V6N13_107068 [Hibiscus sabdariffa]